MIQVLRKPGGREVKVYGNRKQSLQQLESRLRWLMGEFRTLVMILPHTPPGSAKRERQIARLEDVALRCIPNVVYWIIGADDGEISPEFSRTYYQLLKEGSVFSEILDPDTCPFEDINAVSSNCRELLNLLGSICSREPRTGSQDLFHLIWAMRILFQSHGGSTHQRVTNMKDMLAPLRAAFCNL